jgi:hypothetical protein
MRTGAGKPAIVLLTAAMSAVAVPAGTAQAQSGGEFFVPTGERTGFGAFEESRDSPAALRRAFGPPTSERIDDYGHTCTMAWPEIGAVAQLVAFGTASAACSEGVFVEARLTDPRWHTASGVHPGSGKGVARRASLRRCTHRTIGCGVSGYALELHRTACATTLSAGVIAHVRGDRVISLIVRWRSCE